ncbi:MAG: hypothetical protein GTO51_03500 [Candidatus Latescibacteria bacterium]|nr:hypothetical protein [Candidatus Latescibacterota bacterium]NIM20904.1 hypothetical protein [Candidatus Latescibacterota bacterium]NIM65039.1 hypothetical protein [Candidatus Latescibacterota bacterium]NIO01554.1 hypothetical protein [Candidatus Latescibacterota bacterium]NIO28071.1 hypothetical protein [Candidatus Latescibacterota bacterium]
MSKFNYNNEATLLAIRLRQLGDVLATLGALEAVKKSGLVRTIAFVVDSHYHDLLKKADFIDVLLAQPPSVRGSDGLTRFIQYVEDVRSLRAAWTLDFHSNPRSALITALSGAPVRVGFDVRVRKLVYTNVEPRAIHKNGRLIPRTSQDCALAIVRHIGIEAPARRLLTELKPEDEDVDEGRKALIDAGLDPGALDRGGVIGLNPGNPYPAKAWPDEHFIELANRLAHQGNHVVFIWGPGEKERVLSIARRCDPGALMGPSLPLPALPGFLKHLGCLVTIDSGLKHLAACTRVPTVTIFGPTSPLEWHMGGEFDTYVYRGLSCSPCRLLRCPFGSPCMGGITPEAVMEQIEAIDRLKEG